MRPYITGLVIAGGRGSRMDFADKGLVAFQGRAMVDIAIEKLLPAVDTLLVNANRNAEDYARRGFPVLADPFPGFCGPLAGLLSGLEAARPGIVVSVPCDSPKFPADLAARLLDPVLGGAPASYATADGEVFPVFGAWRTTLAPALRGFVGAGNRKVRLWLRQAGAVPVAFDGRLQDFDNLNTQQDLQEAAR